MDIQVVQWIVSGICAVAAWAYGRMIVNLQSDLKEVKKELDRTKETYYRREDFREFKEELFERLRSLEQKIDKSKEQ